jgi:hypothetical protein
VSPRGWIRVAAAVIAVVGCGFPPACALLGTVLGGLFELDPASPAPLGYGLHGLAALAASGVGGVLFLVSVAVAVGLVVRQPWAHVGGLVLGGVWFAVGLVPVAILVGYALLQRAVIDEFWAERPVPAPTPA